MSPPLAPGAGETEDISYGSEAPVTGPFFVEFSVGLKVGGGLPTGNPLSPLPPPPAIGLTQEAGVFGPPPFGDGSTMSDIYQSVGPLGGPICGLFPDFQILDDNGSPGPFGPRLGLNMPPGSNIDAYDRAEEVPLVRPAPATGGPAVAATGIIFFTIDPATAAAWPAAFPIPAPGGGAAIPGPGDVLAWNPAIGGPVIYATAGALGLIPGPAGDNVDGLAVGRIAAAPPLPPAGSGFDFEAAGTATIVFSLAPGSPSLSYTSGGAGATPLTPGCGLPPGSGTAGDLWFVTGPVPLGGATSYLNAEALGLATSRTTPVVVDDNLDAVSICNGFAGVDSDLDGIDDACDFDVDGDLVGNLIDNCPTVSNPSQANNDAVGGTFGGTVPPAPHWIYDGSGAEGASLGGDACDPNNDNDGCTNVQELGANHKFGGLRDPLNPWDFYDVPAPASPLTPASTRDKVINALLDIPALVKYIGTKDNGPPNNQGVDYDNDLNANGIEDGVEFDRSTSTTPGQPWRSGPPDGAVSALVDIPAMVNQIGDHCN